MLAEGYLGSGRQRLGFLNSIGVAIACAIVSGCSGEPAPTENLFARQVEGNVWDVSPVRGEFRPLMYRRSGYEYKCTECHEDFTSPPKQGDLEGEHSAINDAFDHGLNTNCLSCHNNEDRNNYISHDGTSIPSTQPARLCAKCHGPIYRDWERGIHGRQNGHWDRTKGSRSKLLCIQCHDPHNPAFPLMAPEPPPERSRLTTGSGERPTQHDREEESH